MRILEGEGVTRYFGGLVAVAGVEVFSAVPTSRTLRFSSIAGEDHTEAPEGP